MSLQVFAPTTGPLGALTLLQLETDGPVLHLRLNRPAKRNSISDELLAQLHTVLVNLPRECKALILSGAGEHFCAGLDLSEVAERTVAEGMAHSRSWHACFDAIQFGPVPVIAVLHGAVNRAILSYALTGERMFLGHFEQAPACVNVLDLSESGDWIVRAVNVAAYDLVHSSHRQTTMERYWEEYRSHNA